MDRTGYVLVGGRSRRMGSDKALLEYGGTAMAVRAAHALEAAAGVVKLVGDPLRYASLGFPVIPDRRHDCGPLAGVEAALADTGGRWNLIVACDMPGIESAMAETLFAAAETSGALLLAPAGADGRVEPLCAVWHRDARHAVEEALAAGVRRMTDMLPRLRHTLWPIAQMDHFKNLNTPGDWSDYAAR